MSGAGYRFDQTLVDTRQQERATDLVRLMRTMPCTGRELHAALIKTKTEELEAFAGALQKAIEARPAR